MMKLHNHRSPNELCAHAATHFSFTANLNGGFRSHANVGRSRLLTPIFRLLSPAFHASFSSASSINCLL